MKVPLRERAQRDGIAVLSAMLPASDRAIEVAYRTVTGAVARTEGEIVGAFDREHHAISLPPSPRERELTLEVEMHALPTNLLPSGPGVWWWWLNKRASSKPARTVEVETRRADPPTSLGNGSQADTVVLWGHGHLDVAWLWTYEETKRKAVRTFANALALLDRYPQFVFVQSQPQLYEFVREADAALFERIVQRVREGRFDADVAALWIESDCNLPSGESLLRQMLEAHRFCVEHFGIAPSIAWLPDTFGFARTLPSLLAHAGIRYFATTKLHWNDTTRFPYAQFVWRGPDGAEIVAASIANMDRSPRGTPLRRARERNEPMIVGYGDGGGGPTQAQVERADAVGRWERPRTWFARLDAERAALPVHADELYLEYHRGVYTTHHDVKAHNAALERELALAEELAAWCVAVRAPADALARLRDGLREAWQIVLPGTAIAPVYDDARAEYDRAHRLVGTAIATARAMLPRAARTMREPAACAPTLLDDGYIFENERLRARVEPTGAISEIARSGGSNAVAQANLLALYRDRPSRWEAWNVDAGYQRSLQTARRRCASACARTKRSCASSSRSIGTNAGGCCASKTGSPCKQRA
jgi:alpha-mannosidase